MVNIYGELPRSIPKRVKAQNCSAALVSFFREHTVLQSLKDKAQSSYLYAWMRERWNMGVAMNLPTLQSSLLDDYRVVERERRKKRLISNDYPIPLFRDRDFGRSVDPWEKRARVVQRMNSAINSAQSTPYHHYSVLEEKVDEHALQELFWNFSRHIDVMVTVRDQILAEHSNTLFSTRRARALHRHLLGEALIALDRLVSESLSDMKTPPMRLELVGGHRYSADFRRITRRHRFHSQSRRQGLRSLAVVQRASTITRPLSSKS